tara:strand:- start:1804 stop:2454 length:651 start_codon:yes stop_codon:yes gene_type:complete
MYYQKDYERLKTKFSGAENIKENYSQSMQDMFVLTMLNGKRNGIYVEIGADRPKIISNTYLLETEFDWSGVSFEIDGDKVIEFNKVRRNKCICEDAQFYDYRYLFDERNFPKQIDYLQLDIDPAHQTLQALANLPLDEYRFSVITYETDVYRDGADIQEEQAVILKSLGYQLVSKNVMCEGNPYEDWWVDPNVISEDVWKPFRTDLGSDAMEIILK